MQITYLNNMSSFLCLRKFEPGTSLNNRAPEIQECLHALLQKLIQ